METGTPALPSPGWNVAVPVHSNTAQSSPPRIRSTRWFQSGKMASVSVATLCRSVVHGVTGSQNRPPGANRAAKSSGPSIDSKVRAQASQSLVGAHRASPLVCAAQALCFEGHHRVVERQDHLRLHELVLLRHQFDRCPPGREADGMAGEAHGPFGHLDLDHALAADVQRGPLHPLHGRLAGRVHGLGVVGQLDVLALLLDGGAGGAPGGVDEGGTEGEPDGHPAGALEQGEVTGREVRDEGRGRSGAAAHGPHRRADELDVDVVRADRHVDPHPHDPVPVYLAALPAQQAGGLIHGRIVGVRGHGDGASPPVPDPDRDRHDGDAAHEVEGLPSGCVQ